MHSLRQIAKDIGIDAEALNHLCKNNSTAPVYEKAGRLYAEPDEFVNWLDKIGIPIPEDYEDDEDEDDEDEDDD